VARRPRQLATVATGGRIPCIGRNGIRE
jgi:hypothetical protein